MSNEAIENACEELQISACNMVNLDKSTAFPGNREEIDEIRATQGSKKGAKVTKCSITTGADSSVDDIQASIGFTIGTSALGNVWLHVTEIKNTNVT